MYTLEKWLDMLVKAEDRADVWFGFSIWLRDDADDPVGAEWALWMAEGGIWPYAWWIPMPHTVWAMYLPGASGIFRRNGPNRRPLRLSPCWIAWKRTDKR